MNQRRVLYIDDDEALARLLSRSLERAGYEVVHVPSGEAGLERLSRERFDAVALDHHMPGATGLEILAGIRALPDPPPVVYVTGSEASHIAVAALKAGAVDYVWKDVQGHFRELLVEAVDSALEQEAMRQARLAAEAEVRAARDRAELLLKEVNHRLANSLALVASFARLQTGLVKDPAARSALETMQARIHAIAGVHRRLYTSGDVERVALDAYLEALAVDLQRSMETEGHAHTLRVLAEPVEVSTDRAVSIGIIVTELVTNAFKYAYPAGQQGEIRVRLARQDDGRVRLEVEDDGVGLGADAGPKGTGLGGRIVKAMAGNLKAEVQTPPGPGARTVFLFEA
jgi:two-component sensor histidine kinase/CheY-like chemotaxis protein